MSFGSNHFLRAAFHRIPLLLIYPFYMEPVLIPTIFIWNMSLQGICMSWPDAKSLPLEHASAFAKLQLKLVQRFIKILFGCIKVMPFFYSVQFNVWIVFTLVKLTGCVILFQDWARNRFGDRSCSYKRRRSWLSLVSSTPYCCFEFMAPVSLVKVIVCL